MRNAILVPGLLAAALLAGMQGATAGRPAGPRAAAPEAFAKARIYVEFNETDNDTGIHIDTDHDVGLRTLRVVGPNGKTVVDSTWRTRPPLGLTEMATESAEPDPEQALLAYPPGVYRFSGVTIEGDRLVSQATLSHDLLAAPAITSPADGATGVPTTGVSAAWDAVPGAQGYALEIEQGTPFVTKLETTLESTSNRFSIPDGLLIPDTAFQIGVASISSNGNLSLSVIEFHTGS
jgi:hypothetical protein